MTLAAHRPTRSRGIACARGTSTPLAKSAKLRQRAVPSSSARSTTAEAVLTSTLPRLPWSVRLSPARRLAAMVIVGLLAYVLLEPWLPERMRMLIAWNASALAYLGRAGETVAKANPEMTRARAENQDQSGYVIFLLVVTASSASFVAIGFLSAGIKDLPFWPRAGHLTLSVVALLLSWLMIQTLFAFHYARRYYSCHVATTELRRGLKFP